MSGDVLIWSVILGLGLVTYLIRYSFIGLIGDRQLPPVLVQALGFVPVTVLPALVAPAVFSEADGTLALEIPKVVSAAAAVGVGLWTRQILLGLLAGAGAFFLLGWLVG